jgi:flagellar biosynthesis protein FlhA
VIRRHAHELLGRQEVQKLLDNLKGSHPKVVEELVPNLLPLGGVVRVLHNLLREQVPIRDLLAILETLADWAPMTKDPEILTEYVRQALSRTITKMVQTPAGHLPVITFAPNVEQTVSAAIQTTDHGRVIALEPAIAQKIVKRLAELIEMSSARGIQPTLLCSTQIRGPLKRLVDRFIPNLTVLSYDEILAEVEIQSLGTVELSHAD